MNAASLKQNKWVRRAGIALLSLLVLWGVLWVAVPPIAKSQLQKIASDKLGRQFTVGKIDFKPWTLELTLSDLRVATADGSQPQFQVARLYVDAELQSVLRLAPVIDALAIDAPVIKVAHLADGKYDFDDILAKLASGPPEPPDAKKEPPKFAVYNIAISGGSVDFDDQTVKRKHTLRDLVLNVPFLSNLASKREIKVEPKLAFVLNDSKFDSTAESTPFADNLKTDAQLRFSGLDLAPYLGYLPGGLPAKVLAGSLDADIKIDFARTATAGLKLSGTVQAHNIKVADARSRDLLAFESLKVALVDVRPLERVVHLGEVALAAPQLVVARDEAGKLNLLATDPATGATEKIAPVAVPAGAEAAKPSDKAVWKVQVDKVALQGGTVGWRDATTRPAAAVDVKKLDIEASAIHWPMDQPAKFHGAAEVGGAPLKFSGQGTDKLATVQAEIDALPLSLAAPYLAQSLEPTLDGKLSGQVEVAWTQPDIKLKARRVAADGLALTKGKDALVSVGRFELADAEVDLTKHTLAIGSFTANNPKLRVERDSEKRWMFERWMKAPSGEAAKVAAPKPAEATAAAPPGANTRPWQLTIGNVAVDGGALSYADKASETPVEVEITAFKLSAQKIAPDTATVSPVQLSGRIGAGRADPGRFDYKGTVTLKPLAAEGRLEATALPAHAFKAYYADALNIDIRRAFARYKGTVRFAMAPAGPSIKLAGDTGLEDFRANSATLTQAQGLGESRQLLSWKALSLRGLQVSLAPNTPLLVDVKETALTDFYARVIVDPTGRINLQDLVKAKPVAGAAVAAGAMPPPKTFDGNAPAPATPPAAPPVATAQAAPPSGPQPVISFGPMSMVNGKVDFTDLFVKPNYSAALSELTGKLSAFSSKPQGDKPVLADLELRGKAQQTAQLDITGKLNPLVKPLELDITAKMRDLDLAPLSPYAVRYTAHGIERGKLSLDVNYKIAPDGQLTASNKLVLNQLEFGDEVTGGGKSLPVRLAVALLADRNGVIDVDLPISGSINDPQFSIGPLIFKAIVNLIVKAVTAPFSLLTGGLGGGGGESSTIVFDAGSAALPASAKESLDKVAKALTDRPALRMTVVGTANLDKEAEAFKRQRLRQLAQAEKRRLAARSGGDATDVPPVTDAEYPTLLTAVYKRADITKPRNAIGLAKDLPLNEMETLLMGGIAVDEEAIRELAVARGAAVRDYLLAQKLASERLFLGAVKTRATEANWKPGAELDLAMR